MSDKQEERCYQDIKTIKERYQERWDKRIMTDYCWGIKNDLHNTEHDYQERENSYHNSYVSAVSL